MTWYTGLEEQWNKLELNGMLHPDKNFGVNLDDETLVGAYTTDDVARFFIFALSHFECNEGWWIAVRSEITCSTSYVGWGTPECASLFIAFARGEWLKFEALWEIRYANLSD